MTKYLKSEVGYEHPAKGPNHCGGCVHFLKSRERCEIVLGRILAEDWCRKYEAKK